MLQWADVCGVQKADGFELTSDDGGFDVYARTVSDLPAGSPVVFVPEQMILSSNKAAAELRTDEMEDAEKLLKSLNAEDEIRHFYLMIKVLLELEKGQDSPWFPWFNSLPRYYTNAASMTPVSSSVLYLNVIVLSKTVRIQCLYYFSSFTSHLTNHILLTLANLYNALLWFLSELIVLLQLPSKSDAQTGNGGTGDNESSYNVGEEMPIPECGDQG